MGLYDVVEIDDPRIRRMLGRYAEEEYQTKYVLEHGYIRVGTAVAMDDMPPEISRYGVEWYREVRYIDLFLRPKQDVSEKKRSKVYMIVYVFICFDGVDYGGVS